MGGLHLSPHQAPAAGLGFQLSDCEDGEFFPCFLYNPFSRQSCTAGTGRSTAARQDFHLRWTNAVGEWERGTNPGSCGIEVIRALPPQGGRGRQGTWKFLIAWELQCQGKGRRRGGEGGEQHEHTQTLPLIALVSVAESHPCCLPQFPSLYVEDKCLPCPQSA